MWGRNRGTHFVCDAAFARDVKYRVSSMGELSGGCFDLWGVGMARTTMLHGVLAAISPVAAKGDLSAVSHTHVTGAANPR